MKDKMAFFNGRALFSGVAISYLFNLTGTGFWISFLLGLIMGFLLILAIKKVNDSNIVNTICGVILSIIAGVILVNMGHTLYLKETPVFFLTLLPVISVFIISNSKDIALKKITHIFFIYSIFLFFLKIFGLYGHINMENMRPLYPIDVKNIVLGALVFMLVGVVPIISLNSVIDKKNIILNYLVSMISIIFVSFLAVSVLGINEVKLYRYPEYVVLKRINFLNFINNVDSFFNFAIILDLLFTMTNGIKNVTIGGKIGKYVAVLIICFSILLFSHKLVLLLYLYYYFPIILIILLILRLIPKKDKYKKS